MLLGISLLCSAIPIFVINEREWKAKQLQLSSGTSRVTYWLSNYAWDVLYSISLIVLVPLIFAAGASILHFH